RELRQDADDDNQGTADAPSGGIRKFEGVLEEKDEEVAGDGGAEDAHFVKHVADLEPLGGGFGFRERLAEEGPTVEQGGNQEEAELDLPAHALGTQRPADQAADHHARRPRGVEDVQVM